MTIVVEKVNSERYSLYSLSTSKKNRHHQGMRESDLDAIYKTVTGPFQDGEVIVKSRVSYDLLDGFHLVNGVLCKSEVWRRYKI